MIINFNRRVFNKKYISKIKEAYEYVMKFLKLPCSDLEINIDFVSRSKIKDLNTKFRSNPNVTDVLSFPSLLEVGKTDMQLIGYKLTKDNFPMDVNQETGMLFLGDISICKGVVYKHAKEYGNTKLREMVYMAVHGLLHLLGYDHINEDDKKIMRDVEEKIMSHIDLRRD